MTTKPPKTDRLELRVDTAEKELFQRAADRDGRPLSNWIRDRLLRVAREELAEEGRAKGRGKRAASPRPDLDGKRGPV